MDTKELLINLINIPSLSREEKKIAEYLAKYLYGFCDKVEIDEMFNVKAELIGNSSGPTYLFNGHLDHVAAADMPDPFSAKIMLSDKIGVQPFGKEVVVGRGACDNKGAVAAMAKAAEDLSTMKDRFRGKLILLFVTREEEGEAPGTRFALKKSKEKIDIAVLGEATQLDVYLGHRGKVEFILETIGKSAHASNPDNGINAILLMSDFIQSWKKEPFPEHNVLGKCTTAITKFICPDPGRTAVIPSSAKLFFDRRYLPDETPKDVEEQVRKVLEKLSQENKNFQYNLKINYVMPPYLTSPDNSFVQPLKAAIASQNHVPKLGAWLFGGDGTFMVNDFGIPTLGFGPGSEQFAHTHKDHIFLSDLEAARNVYRDFILNSSR